MGVFKSESSFAMDFRAVRSSAITRSAQAHARPADAGSVGRGVDASGSLPTPTGVYVEPFMSGDCLALLLQYQGVSSQINSLIAQIADCEAEAQSPEGEPTNGDIHDIPCLGLYEALFELLLAKNELWSRFLSCWGVA